MIQRTIWALAAAITITPNLGAATFRVTAKIYEGDNPRPAAEHWILFDNGLVYDLPQIDDRFVTVFDPARKRVTLLDRQDQVQTTLSTDFLLEAAAQTRAAASTPQQKVRIGVSAKVEPSQRVAGYAIRFGNFEYHTTTQEPDNRDMAVEYGQFTLLASQLNLVRRLGPPPFGRMTLSEHMAQHGELPLESTLTLRRGRESREIRSTHRVQELSDADREKIHEVRSMLALYRDVSLKEFP